jgi:hypothetical protein
MKDKDSDNIDDTFQNKTSSISETDVEKQDDGTYLIDSNADGEWDKTYDPETQAYAKYTGVSLEDKNGGDNTILYIAIAFVIIILILFGYLVKRGKK